MSNTSVITQKLSELENQIWLPPNGHTRRNEAYTKIKDEILAELQLDPDNLLLKALLA